MGSGEAWSGKVWSIRIGEDFLCGGGAGKYAKALVGFWNLEGVCVELSTSDK